MFVKRARVLRTATREPAPRPRSADCARTADTRGAREAQVFERALGPPRGLENCHVINEAMHGEATSPSPANLEPYVPSASWRVIDAEIVRLGAKKGELELEEGRWLLAARRAAVHTKLGFATFAEYVERRLGLDPRATAERLRVAQALADLPRMRETLRSGARPWTAVREMVRVCVPDTEAEWIAASDGRTVREVERMVAGLAPGDRPSDPKDPALRKHVVRLEMSPELYARFREATDKIRKEVDPNLCDEEALGVMVDRALGGASDEGRSAFQISVTVCADCERTWQNARGELVEVEREVGERARCDGNVIGPVPPAKEGAPLAPSTHVGLEGRARQTVTPKVRRAVFLRDGGRCVVNGCRNTRFLEVHHLRPRCEGGGHELDNLALACGTHHRLHHQGRLLIEGTPSLGLRFLHADGTPYGAPPARPASRVRSEADAALRALEIPAEAARLLLDEAEAGLPDGASVEDLVRAALRFYGRARAEAIDGAGLVAEPSRYPGGYTPALSRIRARAHQLRVAV